VLRFIRYSLRLRRVEYRVAELPIFLIPVLLTAPDRGAFASAAFWEGLCIFLFLFSFGDLLNCLADRDLDAVYKPQLTEAVDGLTKTGVAVQAALSALAALALTAHLAWLLDRWVLLPLVVVGLFVAYAYSVEPLRLKGRGLWQLGFYWLGLFTGPMIFTAFLFQPWPGVGVLAVGVTYGLMQTGVILVNTAEDYPEDRQMGVKTAILALGLWRGITAALVLAVAGAAGLIASLLIYFPRPECLECTLTCVVPLALAALLVCVAIARLRWRMRGGDEAGAVAAVKASARWVPVWITALAVTSLLAAGLLRWGQWNKPPAQAAEVGVNAAVFGATGATVFGQVRFSSSRSV
jgi:UbiA prenyltransferase family